MKKMASQSNASYTIFRGIKIDKLGFFFFGLLIGSFLCICFSLIKKKESFVETVKTNQKKVVKIQVSNIHSENTNYRIKELYNFNQELSRIKNSYSNLEWLDSLKNINYYVERYLNGIDFWQSLVIDSNSYEIFMRPRFIEPTKNYLLTHPDYFRPREEYFVITKDTIFCINLEPLFFIFDSITYTEKQKNTWVRKDSKN